MLNEGGGQQASESPAPPEPQESQSDADPFQSAQTAGEPASAEPPPSDSGDASGDEQSAFKAPS